MLDYKNQISSDYQQVLKELDNTPFVPIDYPKDVGLYNWDDIVSDSIIPKMEGHLYFIYDSNKTLLYIGKSLEVNMALRSHLVRKYSKSMTSILDNLKESVRMSKDKRIYIKVIDIQPREYSGCFKPMLARHFIPKWNQRIS